VCSNQLCYQPPYNLIAGTNNEDLQQVVATLAFQSGSSTADWQQRCPRVVMIESKLQDFVIWTNQTDRPRID
jgi:hypothetical protein